MQENKSEDPVCLLRSKNRTILSSLRKNDRDDFLKHRRLKLEEVEKNSQELSLKEFKEFVLDFKQRKGSLHVDILKKLKNSCCSTEYIEAFFRINGAFEALIRHLKSQNAQIQLEAVACIINLACGSHKLCFRVAKTTGAYLVSFLSGSSHYLQDQCAWAVGNIANDCIKCYSMLKSQGVFPALLNTLMSPIADVAQSTIYALCACMKYGDIDLIDINRDEYTNYLLKIIEEHILPLNTLREAVYILSNTLYIGVEVGHDFSTFNIIKLLNCLKQIMFEEETDSMLALLLVRCLGYLTTYEWVSKHLWIDNVFFEIALKILNHTFCPLRKELLWALTNISVFQVIDTDHHLFLPTLKGIEIFLNPLDQSVLSVLYYICCTATQSKSISSFYHQQGMLSKVEGLATCGTPEIENASKVCQDIIRNQIDVFV